MALPYDALTAALDAWLGQHIPNLQATVVPLDALIIPILRQRYEPTKLA